MNDNIGLLEATGKVIRSVSDYARYTGFQSGLISFAGLISSLIEKNPNVTPLQIQTAIKDILLKTGTCSNKEELEKAMSQ